jgi:hypothetical protein
MHDLECEIVVAKYKEHLGWTERSPWPVTIYDKCPGYRYNFPQLNYIDTKNFKYGREAHTYLLHITNRYHSLSKTTLFVQGMPFDHYPNFFDVMRTGYRHRDVTGISWYKGNMACPNDSWFETTIEDTPICMGIRKDPRWMEQRWTIALPGEKMPDPFIFASGAQFFVPKWRILQRPKSFYERLLLETQKEPCVLDAWFFEMLWFYIFGGSNPRWYSPRANGKVNPLCFD